MERLYVWIFGPLPTIEELLQLVYGAPASVPERLHEMLDWRFQRVTLVAKGLVGSAAGLVTTLLVASFKGELQVASRWIFVAVAGAAVVALIGLAFLRRVATIGPRLRALRRTGEAAALAVNSITYSIVAIAVVAAAGSALAFGLVRARAPDRPWRSAC
jgi:hypothetical protein